MRRTQIPLAHRLPVTRKNSTKGAYPFALKEAQYEGYTDAMLDFARKDAHEAAQNMKGHDGMAENWYMDDVHTISAEIRRRQGKR